MVFGIGEGKMEIKLPKTDYVYGESIRGKAVLTLNQPKKARGIRVELKAEHRVWKTRMEKGRTQRYQQIETAYSFVLPLKGEGEFTSSEYDFELIIPKNSLQPPSAPTIKLGPITIGPPRDTPLQWFVIASLDLPLSLDIHSMTQIQVSNPPTPAAQPSSPQNP